MNSKSNFRLAIVHDALINTGGAERSVILFHETYPDAPVYTSVYLADKTYPQFRSMDVRPFPWIRFARTEQRAKMLFPAMVWGFEHLALEYDVVLSSSTFAAKAVRPAAPGCHVCYCYNPFRLAWEPDSYFAAGGSNTLSRFLLPGLSRILRSWDYNVTRRIDYLVTTCRNVSERIEACYGRRAAVINPPITFDKYRYSDKPGNYYLIVSRLNTYKRIDLAVSAFNRYGKPLLIIGDGPERRTLERGAANNIRFLGQVTDETLIDIYQNCRAVILPGEEDYGLVPLEAQASGKPVIAYGRGGALETVRERETGLFFDEQSPEALIEALERSEGANFDPYAIRKHAVQFDVTSFKQQIQAFVSDKWRQHQEHSAM